MLKGVPSYLPGLVFLAAMWCESLALISLQFAVPYFLSATLVVTGAFLVFAWLLLQGNLPKPVDRTRPKL
jgi:hypothetical protein